MLKTLEIENIAVIEKASVDFSAGLNVLTGETGAGKSIVVDSINAILGERTTRELVRHGADYAAVSALFENVNKSVLEALKKMGFEADEDGSILLYRKISSQGKSSCRINGMPCTVSILKNIGSLLVNIHGQHDSQSLLNPDLHYRFIDLLADDESVFSDYRTAFKEFISVRRKLKSLNEDEETKERRLELLNYQINELESADIQPGERDKLTSRRNEIADLETIRSALMDAVYILGGDDEFGGITGYLNDITAKLQQSESLNEPAENAAGILDNAEALKQDLENRLESLDIEPQELENIEARLDLFYKLSLKYGSTEEEMLSALEDMKKQRDEILFADKELERLSEEYDVLLEKAVNAAERLSEYRKKTAAKFEKEVCQSLSFLDMPSIKFIVDFKKGKLSSTGFDDISFYISTNPGEPPKPLSKIASGGELSRIMLAIKNIIAGHDTVGTLIFDEIDTGVSGRASRKIGLKLKSVSKDTQVICVTHSAQIASAADTHFLIIKHVSDGRTFTDVKPLDFEGRKHELARIMGGLEISEAMLSSAEELLRSSDSE